MRRLKLLKQDQKLTITRQTIKITRPKIRRRQDRKSTGTKPKIDDDNTKVGNRPDQDQNSTRTRPKIDETNTENRRNEIRQFDEIKAKIKNGRNQDRKSTRRRPKDD